jgi:hypothetical protein
VERRVSHDKHGTHVSYEPVIAYSYSVVGTEYQGKRVYPLGSVSGSQTWARRVSMQYHAGQAAVAYYSPASPASSFLIPEAQFLPHIFSLFPLIFAVIGIYLVMVSLHNRRPARGPEADGPGSFRLAERGTLRHRFRARAGLTAAWYLYCAAVLGDYWSLKHSADAFLIVAMALCFGLGIVGFVGTLRSWRLCHDFLDATVHASQERICPGDELSLRVRLPVLRAVEISQMAVGVVCVRDDRTRSGNKTNYSTNEDWSKWTVLDINRSYQGGAEVDAQSRIRLEEGASPSSELHCRVYPFYRWHVALRVATEGQPNLEVHYPITVESSLTPGRV